MWNDNHVIGAFIIGTVAGITLLTAIIVFTGTTYKDGQIDAMTNRASYKLITLPDSTKEWRKK